MRSLYTRGISQLFSEQMQLINIITFYANYRKLLYVFIHKPQRIDAKLKLKQERSGVFYIKKKGGYDNNTTPCALPE